MAKKETITTEEREIKDDPIIEKEEPQNKGGFTFETKMAASGAEYWNFEENDFFVGTFVSALIPEDGDKTGEEIGYNFKRWEIKNNQVFPTEEMWIISNSYSIEKVLMNTIDGETEIVKDLGYPIAITFLGKGESSSGRPFNKFKIDVLVPAKKNT